MSDYYVPGTEETDLKKVIQSLQQAAGTAATAADDAATNAANIATNTASIANHEAAWTSYTPTLSAGSGSFTSAIPGGGCRYHQIGKTVFVTIVVVITTNGTASGFVGASLPVTPKSSAFYVLHGRDGTGGKSLAGVIGTTPSDCVIVNYDNTYPGASGAVLTVTGVYEAA